MSAETAEFTEALRQLDTLVEEGTEDPRAVAKVSLLIARVLVRLLEESERTNCLLLKQQTRPARATSEF